MATVAWHALRGADRVGLDALQRAVSAPSNVRSCVLGVLNLHAQRQQALKVIRGFCSAREAVDQNLFVSGKLAHVLMLAEQLPVHLAQWVGVVTGQQVTRAEPAGGLTAALPAAGVVRDGWGSVERVRTCLDTAAKPQCYAALKSRISKVSNIGVKLVARVLGCPHFTALWGWSTAICEGLVGQLEAACVGGDDSPSGSGTIGSNAAGLVAAVAAIREAAGIA